MKKEQIKLYKAVDRILWEDWDPIGINNFAPRDEYQSYVPELFAMLVDGRDENEISDRLNKIATERMGLQGDREHCLKVAKKIIKQK